EDQSLFLSRYGPAQAAVSDWIDAFSPDEMAAWAEDLGQATFVGSSGRVFPRAMKASPLLRAWLGRLNDLGVVLKTRSRWTGWSDNGLTFEDGTAEEADAVVLAMGGASWPRLGSDGAWVPALEAAGVEVAPLRPSNAGFNVVWSDILIDKAAGQALKPVGLSFGEQTLKGEVMLTRYGVEGGGVYALSAALREAIARDGEAILMLDLRPDLTEAALAERLGRPRGKDSMTNHLRKAGGLSAAAIAVLRDIPGEMPAGADKLAKRIKGVRLKLTGMQGIERAISTAGGVTLGAVNQRLMLTARPGVFVAGEMIDWEAPTGGYLLQASFASGVVAANGVLDWLKAKSSVTESA
ncbi:MAG TPA: TIGR03862 family flavoprotein, partial [Brevundimonas sp.]